MMEMQLRSGKSKEISKNDGGMMSNSNSSTGTIIPSTAGGNLNNTAKNLIVAQCSSAVNESLNNFERKVGELSRENDKLVQEKEKMKLRQTQLIAENKKLYKEMSTANCQLAAVETHVQNNNSNANVEVSDSKSKSPDKNEIRNLVISTQNSDRYQAVSLDEFRDLEGLINRLGVS